MTPQDKKLFQQALDALEVVKADLVHRAEMDEDDGGAILNISNGALHRMGDTITAIRAHLANSKEQKPVARCIDAAAGEYECLRETPNGSLLYLHPKGE